MPADREKSMEFLAPKPRRADGATLTVLFVVSLMIIPSKLVFRGIPLSVSPAVLIGIGISLCLFFAHFTSTLGAAKGRSVVRTAVIVYFLSVLATYGYVTYGYLPPDELPLTDHTLVNILAVVGVALVVCDGVRGRDRLDFVLKAVVVSGTVVAAIGVIQFLVGFDLAKYLTLPIFRFGVDNHGFIAERSSFRRPAGTTGTPIEFGVVCAMVLPLALHYGFRARERLEREWGWWLCCALLGSGAIFAISRSAILGLVVGGIVLFIGWPRGRRSRVLLVSMAFLLGMKLAFPGLLGTIYGSFYNLNSDNSVKYRTHDYPVAFAEIARHVWLGRGFGTWYSPKYQVFDNQYLSTLVEGGFIGLLAVAGLFLAGIYGAARALYLAVDPEQRDLALTLLACLVVPVVGAATFDLFAFGTGAALTFVLIGAVGSLVRIARQLASETADRSKGSPERSVLAVEGRDRVTVPIASVVVPAHNEEAVLARTLERLLSGSVPGELDVVVVPNACSDKTADVARRAGVRVLETSIPGKANALRLGDAACRTFPRVYLDADVELSVASVRLLVAALAGSDALACAPIPEWDLTGASWMVRRVHRTHDRLVAPHRVLAGAGVYVLSEPAHKRVFPLPDVVADDEWVHRSFDVSERVVVPGARSFVRPPRTVATHLRRRVRVRQGNRQLVELSRPPAEGQRQLRALGQLIVRRTVSPLDAACYLTVVGVERGLTRWRLLRGGAAWGTDRSSR